jgi:hypothetical protein
MPRIINDFGKRPRFHTCVQLMEAYYRARRLELSHGKSCQYAMAHVERSSWHNSFGIPLTAIDRGGKPYSRYGWYKGRAKIDISPKRFKEIMVTRLGRMPPLELIWQERYYKGARAEAALRLAVHAVCLKTLKKGRPDLVKKVERAVKNFRAVVGDVDFKARKFEVSPEKWLTHGGVAFQEWARCSTGRQLFVQGWGRFDIDKAVDDATTGYDTLCPSEITAAGYGFTDRKFLLLAKAKVWRSWFTRHWKWWRENLARIDELRNTALAHDIRYTTAQTYVREHPDCTPLGLITHIANLNEQAARNYVRYGTSRLAPPGPYAWLADVPAQPVPQGQLVPVRDRGELSKVSSQLQNCAGSYHSEIAFRECMMVALLDQNGKALALGELLPNGRWSQISGPSNKKLDKDVKQLFHDYTPTAMKAVWVPDKTEQIKEPEVKRIEQFVG